MTRQSRRLDYLPSNKLGEELTRTDVVMIPVGAIEPHGHHAPLGADHFIAGEIAERLAEASGGLVFPPMPLGVLNVVYDFRSLPGSISIDAKVLIDVYTNIGTELARAGFRRLVFVNGHACNTPVLGIVAYRIRETAPVEVGILEWWACAEEEVKAIKGFTFASHGDEIETALVMASAEGHLVDLADAVVNSRTLEALSEGETALYRARIPFTRTLDERWIGESGNMGDPTRATAANGDRLMRRTVETGLKLLDVLAEQQRHRAR